MGKTALLDEAAGLATDMTVLHTRGVEVDSVIPFAGLFDLLRPVFGLIDGLPPAQLAALNSALGLGPPVTSSRFAICTGTLALLAAAAEREPVLVVVDDAHWLDGASADAVLFAARRLRMDRVGLLFAVRDGEPRSDLAQGLDEVRLGGLGPQVGAQILVERLGLPVARPVVRYLCGAAEGNPLALLEAARALSRRQLLGAEPLPRRLPLRVSAADLYRERIARLGQNEAVALLMVSLDSTANAAVLLRSAGTLGVDYGTALSELEAHGLLTVDLGLPSVAHPLVRAAAEQSAPPATVRLVHAALATALRGGPDTGPRAWHLAAAATEPDEEASAALEAAARGARRRSAYGTAAVAYEHSARLTLDDPTRARRLLDAAEASRLAGRVDDGLRLLNEAETATADAALQAQIAQEKARGELHHGRTRRAQELLELAAARVDGTPDAGRLLGIAAFCATLAGDPGAAVALATRGRALLGKSREAIIELSLGLALLHSGEVAESLGVLLRAAELTEREQETGDPEFLPFAALAFTWAGDFRAARGVLATVLPRARDEASFGLLCSALYASAYLEARTGHLLAAYAEANEAVMVAEATSSELWHYLSLCCLAYIEAAQGREEDCRLHATQAAEICSRLELSYPATTLDALGLLELGFCRPEKAMVYLEQANMRSGGVEAALARSTGPDLVEASLRAGCSLSQAVVARLRASSQDERFPNAAALAWRCLGIAATGEAELDACFAAALRLHALVDNPFTLARTEFCYGEGLRRLGRRRDARMHLRRARLRFEDLGAAQWVKRVDDELRAAGGSTTGADGAGGALTSLTPQELHVALTVARGATNREVATALYLSPKTVEFHLSQVYRKLSIRSRTELAARIVGIEGVPDPGGGGVSGAASAVPTGSPPASGASRPVRAGTG